MDSESILGFTSEAQLPSVQSPPTSPLISRCPLDSGQLALRGEPAAPPWPTRQASLCSCRACSYARGSGAPRRLGVRHAGGNSRVPTATDGNGSGEESSARKCGWEGNGQGGGKVLQKMLWRTWGEVLLGPGA